jgi:hypothetical protein
MTYPESYHCEQRRLPDRVLAIAVVPALIGAGGRRSLARALAHGYSRR